MGIICRSHEVRLLETILASKKAEFLAIFGRRRVGKTYLICSFFEKKNCVFFSVMGTKDGTYKDQIAHFTQRIGETFLGGISPQPKNNWDETFKMLRDAINQVPKNKKIVMFHPFLCLGKDQWHNQHSFQLLMTTSLPIVR